MHQVENSTSIFPFACGVVIKKKRPLSIRNKKIPIIEEISSFIWNLTISSVYLKTRASMLLKEKQLAKLDINRVK